jgi:hypothetical protein
VSLSSDPSLFPSPQLVTASSGGREVARVRLVPNEQAKLRVPLDPGSETCLVVFRVDPTAVPSEVDPGSTDDRVLGAHFNAFVYEPAT